MKPYSDYSAEELAMENLFIRWVRFPDDPSIRAFWENWMIKYPLKKDTVEKARELVLTASDWKPETLTNQEVNSLWNRIMSSLEMISDREPTASNGGFFLARSLVRGVIVLIVSIALLILFYIAVAS